MKADAFVFFLLFLKRRNKKATAELLKAYSCPRLLFCISALRNSLKRALKHLSLRSNSPQAVSKHKINTRLQQRQNHAPRSTSKYYFPFFVYKKIKVYIENISESVLNKALPLTLRKLNLFIF